MEAALTREFGVEWMPRGDGKGSEISGITRTQIENYSSRSPDIDEALGRALDAWRAEHPGLEPSRREPMYLHRKRGR